MSFGKNKGFGYFGDGGSDSPARPMRYLPHSSSPVISPSQNVREIGRRGQVSDSHLNSTSASLQSKTLPIPAAIPPQYDRKPAVCNKKAQVSIYIIAAIVLVLLIVFVYTLNRNVGDEQIPQDLVPVFDYYLECINAEVRTAVDLAEIGGGRIAIGDYVPGSEYAPFSSHLNFLGSPVEYWYSVEGNGVIKKNVPTKSEIEEEIADYAAEGLKHCDFEYFYSQGYDIELGDALVEVDILERKVEVDVISPLVVGRNSDSATKEDHRVELDSKLGKFYNLATEIYNEEMAEAFLESYAVDVLYNYAPVDGADIQCGPKIWLTNEVVDSLKTGLQENFQTIKLKGNYYDLVGDDREYFVYEKEVDEAANILYFKDWPSRIEINGDGVDDSLMIAEPVGTEAGMGVMGFCYVPYHFIYDMKFPVMIQLYDSDELFQFPFVVVIDKNMPRNALPGAVAYVDEEDFELCEFMNEDISINLYDNNLNAVDGNVSLECFDKKCRLGETVGGVLRTPAPACVNGYLHVRASGFAEKKQLISTNRENFADIILDRERTLDVELEVGGVEVDDEIAIVSFARDDGKVTTIALPEQKEIKLSEGSYEVKVYVYGNSSINLPESTKTECVDMPRGGLLGLLGSTKEECFDITIPAEKIESALVGGGVSDTYLLDSELKKGKLKISVDKLPVPKSLEALSQNFETFETKKVWMEFDDE